MLAMTRVMYDDVSADGIPADATMVAGYVDGRWPSAAAMFARFPNAVHVTITVWDGDALVLDVETGDATPQMAPGWVARQRAAGKSTVVYCSQGTWPSVQGAFDAAGVSEPDGYWIARYDNDPSIPPDWAAARCVAKQHQSTDNYDVSTVLDTWPGLSGVTNPTEEEFFPMAIFANDDDARRYFVRQLYNEQLGREPSADEQTGWVSYLVQHGADLTLAAIRDSAEAQGWRKAHAGAAG